MKQWFPFTDYDFYGYLSCGLVLLFATDYSLTGGRLVVANQWSFIEGVLFVALAYITGQVISMPSSIVLEHGLARKLLRPPTVVLLSDTSDTMEKCIETLLIGRYYQPLPEGMRKQILSNAEKDTGVSATHLKQDCEQVFMAAYTDARKNENASKRMDDFRNQYGFNRNMAFSGFLAVIFLTVQAWETGSRDAWTLALFALLLSLGMLVRFLKFYSAFTAEVFRTYAFRK